MGSLSNTAMGGRWPQGVCFSKNNVGKKVKKLLTKVGSCDIIKTSKGETSLINKKGCDQRKCRKARKENTMTNREFYTAVMNGNINEEIVAHAEKALAMLDKRNATRSSKPSKTQIENQEKCRELVEWFTQNEGVHTASEIAEAFEISTQKASALCRQLGEMLEVSEVKVPKKGKCKGYTLVGSVE